VNLGNLETLIISPSQLSRLPSGIRQLKGLKGLFMAGGRLESIPGEIAKLTQLEEVALEHNMLTSSR